mmetsp:Transcript_6353/g.17287  ORF Transcript_6353/g.17287 Transcript_6353/m.17287 type:complete len:98 (-) Transcript_6353:504-797(-)
MTICDAAASSCHLARTLASIHHHIENDASLHDVPICTSCRDMHCSSPMLDVANIPTPLHIIDAHNSRHAQAHVGVATMPFSLVPADCAENQCNSVDV